jgi:hypothetical protein
VLVNSRIKSQTDRYLRILIWMLNDAFREFKTDILIILSSSIVGVIMQGGILAIILTYASFLEDNRTLEYMGFAIESRSDVAFFSMGGLTCVFLIISALLIYISKKKSAVLSVDYEEHCSKRVFKLIGARPKNFGDHNTTSLPRVISQEQTNNTMGCGRAIGTVLDGAFPLAIFIYMAVFLTYINLEVTLSIFILFIFFLSYHYKVNLFVVRNEDQLQELQPKSRKDLLGLVTLLTSLNNSHPDMGDHIDLEYQTENIKGSFDGIRNRRMSVAKADFASNMMIAIAMSLVVIYLGRQALVGDIPWGEVIIYLIGLRIGVMGIRGLLNNIASYARWYPRVRDHFDFINSAREDKRAENKTNQLRVTNRKNVGDVDEYLFKDGDVIGVVTPMELNRYTLFYYIDEVLCANKNGRRKLRQGVDFISDRPYIKKDISLRDYLGISADLTWDDLRNKAPIQKFINKLEKKFEGDLDCTLTGDILKSRGMIRGIKLSLLAAFFYPSKFFMVTEKVMSNFDLQGRTDWLMPFSDRILIICYQNDLTNVGSFGEEVIVIGDTDGQCAMGTVDWVKKNHDLLNEKLLVDDAIESTNQEYEIDDTDI